jgi:hypothetical protein
LWKGSKMAEAGRLTQEELARFDAASVAALQDAIVKERARSLLKRMRSRMQVWERALEEIIPKKRRG